MFIVLGDGLLGSEIKKSSQHKIIQIVKKDLNLAKDSVKTIKAKLSLEYITFCKKNIKNGAWPSRPTYLINAAGYTNVDTAETNQDEAYKTNTEGAYKLAIACKALGITLLHLSTDFVFDGISCTPFTEYDQPNPVNYYGYTKLMSEKMIMNSGCKYAIVRSGWLYDDNKGLVPTLLNKVINKEKLVGVQDQRLTPTHVKDLTKQIFKICENQLTGVFHATCDGWATPIDLLKLMSKEVHGEELSIWPLNTCNFLTHSAPRPINCVLENLNLKALGLNTLPHWKNSVLALIKKTLDDKKTK